MFESPLRRLHQLAALGLAGAGLLGGCAVQAPSLAAAAMAPRLALAAPSAGVQPFDVRVEGVSPSAAGYVVTVTNAATGASLPRMADAPAAGATLVAAEVPETDAEGHCRLWLVGVAPGTRLKVSAAAPGRLLNTVVTYVPAGEARLRP